MTVCVETAALDIEQGEFYRMEEKAWREEGPQMGVTPDAEAASDVPDKYCSSVTLERKK